MAKKIRIRKRTVAGHLLKIQEAHKRWLLKRSRISERSQPLIKKFSKKAEQFLGLQRKNRTLHKKHREQIKKMLEEIDAELLVLEHRGLSLNMHTLMDIWEHIDEIYKTNPELADRIYDIEEEILELKDSLFKGAPDTERNKWAIQRIKQLVGKEAELYREYKRKRK